MTKFFVPSIVSASVNAQKPFHAIHQVGAGCLGHQVKMITHQTPGVNLPIGFRASLSEGFQEQSSVVVVLENGFPAITAVHHMVNRSRVLHSELSSHTLGRVWRTGKGCQVL